MKVTESELKNIIKEEVLRKIQESMFDEELDKGELAPVYDIVDKMEEIAGERVYEQGPEDSPIVRVTVDVEEATDNPMIEYEGKPAKVSGEIEYTFRFHDYDDAEMEDWEPNLQLQFEDGETLPLEINDLM